MKIKDELAIAISTIAANAIAIERVDGDKYVATFESGLKTTIRKRLNGWTPWITIRHEMDGYAVTAWDTNVTDQQVDVLVAWDGLYTRVEVLRATKSQQVWDEVNNVLKPQ